MSWDLETMRTCTPCCSRTGHGSRDRVATGRCVSAVPDFLPARGFPQLLQQSVFTDGVSPISAASRARRRLTTSSRRHRSRASHPDRARASRRRARRGGRRHVRDARERGPVADLEPYPRGVGHALIISADRADAVHSPPCDAADSPGGPQFSSRSAFRGLVITGCGSRSNAGRGRDGCRSPCTSSRRSRRGRL